MTKNKQDIFNSWKSAIKKDLKMLVQKSGLELDTVQNQMQTFMKKADDLMTEKNLNRITKKLKVEHEKLLKTVDRTIKAEVKKANKLLLEKKKKLKKLQKKFEKEFSISIKSAPKKKTTKKKASRKKTTRKTTRKTA